MHVYTYSETGGKKGNEGKFTVSGCLGEAFRDEGHTKHIKNPDKKIEFLHGNRQAIEQAIETYQKEFKDSRGHKLRKDGKSLLAGVFSWPPGTTREQFIAGCKLLMAWLLVEYGLSLRCVLIHEDEPFQRGKHKGETHFHAHFFVVPPPDKNMKEFHPGLKAKAEARAAGKGFLEQDMAYKRAMGDWQDRIHQELGIPLGFEKARPENLREKRLSRREQKFLEKAEDRATKITDNAEKKGKKIIDQAHRTEAAWTLPH